MKAKINIFKFALFFLGVTSIVAQVIIIRELIAAFYGNELFLGLALAFWLLSTGLGSIYLSRLFKRESEKFLFWLYLVFPFIIFLAFILIRIARLALADPGVIPNLIIAALWGLIVIAPVGMMFGAVFVLLAKLLKDDQVKAVTCAYIVESLGFFAGAIVFNFFIIQLPALAALMVIAIISLVLALQIGFRLYRTGPYLISILIIVVAISLGWAGTWDQTLLSFNYKGENIIESKNTKYSSLAVTKTAEQYNFYSNGQLIDNTENNYHNELLAHPPLILQADARKVLLIGNGFSGLVEELNKYPLEKITYLEMDRDYFRLGRGLTDFISPDNTEIIHQDARVFLRANQEKYDAVLINYSNPGALADNRYFTREFFALTKAALSDKGMVALIINTTPNYQVGAQNRLLASLYATLGSEFEYIKALPDNEVLFLAGPGEIKQDMNQIEARHKRLAIKNQYLHSGYLYWRLTNDRAGLLAKELVETDAPVNSDFKPILYYYQLQTFLEKMNIDFNLLMLAVFFFIISAGLIFIFIKKPDIYYLQLLIPSMLVELALMAYEVLLILLFQAYHGVLYVQLTLIIALILFGIALGSYVCNRLFGKFKDKQLIKYAFISILISFFIPLLIVWLAPGLLYYKFIFYALSLLAGFAVGTKFPIINKFYLRKNSRVGAVYGADLIGGAIGALLAGVFLLPVLGVTLSLGLFVVLSSISLVILMPFMV